MTNTGLNNGGNTITNVAAGNLTSTSTDAVNGSQLYATNQAIEAVTATASKGWNTTTAATGTGTVSGTSVANVAPGTTVTTTAGNNISITQSGTALTIATNPDLVSTSLTTGNTKVNTSGLTITGGPSITTTGIDAGSQKITNVLAGTLASTSTDAVNGSQLYATNQQVASNTTAITNISNEVNNIGNEVNNLGNRVNQVGALNAAMSGLKPLQYDPLERTQIMAAYGNYHSGDAVALGLAYYINESTMVHAGAAFGHGDQMYNLGATWKIGSSDAEKAIPEKYRSGPISSIYVMQDELRTKDKQITQLQEQNNHMQEQIDYLMGKIK